LTHQVSNLEPLSEQEALLLLLLLLLLRAAAAAAAACCWCVDSWTHHSTQKQEYHDQNDRSTLALGT
jgi:hypothetical protein